MLWRSNRALKDSWCVAGLSDSEREQWFSKKLGFP